METLREIAQVQILQLPEQQRKNQDNQELLHFLLWEIEDCLIVPSQPRINQMIASSELLFCKM